MNQVKTWCFLLQLLRINTGLFSLKVSSFAAWSCSTLLITSLQGVTTPHNKILSVWTKAWGAILTVVTVVQKGSCYNL